jgi:hypothetical protein
MPRHGNKTKQEKGKGKDTGAFLQPSEAQEVPGPSAHSTESNPDVIQHLSSYYDPQYAGEALSDSSSRLAIRGHEQTDMRIEGPQQLGMDDPTQREGGGSNITQVHLGDYRGNILAIGFQEPREYDINEVIEDYQRELLDPRIAGRAIMAGDFNPNIKGNCHGFSLTGRLDMTIDESSSPSMESTSVHPVQAVIDHFQFQPVAAQMSQEHDLVTYYNDANELIHTGRVFIDKETKKPIVGSLPGEAPFTYHDFDAVFSNYRCSDGEPRFIVWHTDDPSKGYLTPK